MLDRICMLRILLIICLCVGSKPSTAQGLGLSSFHPDSILIGDHVSLKLSLTLPKESHLIAMPTLPDKFGKIEVLRTGPVDSVVNENEVIYEQRYQITCFDSGFYALPLWYAQIYNGKTAQKDSVAIRPSFLYVNTIAGVDTTKPFKSIFEIKVESAPDFFTKLRETIVRNLVVLAIILIVFLLALGVLIWYLFFRKNKNKKNSLPPEPPHDKAIRRLKELEQASLWEQKEYKLYYSKLSDVLKTYLDEVCDMPAQEMTTRDLLHAIKRNNNWRRIHGELRQILSHADLAKFAKSVPTNEEKDQDLKNAYRIIQVIHPSADTRHDAQ